MPHSRVKNIKIKAFVPLLRINQIKRLLNVAVRFREFTLREGAPGLSQSILGRIGEYYAFLEFLKQGFLPEEKSGHSRYDFLLHSPTSNKKLRVEVRTSLLKNEGVYSKDILFYGWKVQSKKQEILNFDVLVCVTLDNAFTSPQFYLFTLDEARQLKQVKMSRYTNVKRKIHLFRDIRMFNTARKEKPDIISKLESDLNNQRKKYRNRWKILTVQEKVPKRFQEPNYSLIQS